MACCPACTPTWLHRFRLLNRAAVRYGSSGGRVGIQSTYVALICDTGPLYAAMDRADQDHEICRKLFQTVHEPLVVPGPVVVELDWLASSRLGPSPFANFLTDVQQGMVRVAELVPADYARIRDLLARYADFPLGFVDASVMAVVERFEENKLATLDHRHFRIIRPRHRDSLILLPQLA